MFFPQQTQTQGPLGQMQSQMFPPIFPIFPYITDHDLFINSNIVGPAGPTGPPGPPGTPGVVPVTNGGSDLISVKLTAVNYTALATDYYIGATKKDITIILPLGIVGKVYIIKNQIEGSIKIKGIGQNLDNAGDKTLGSEKSLFVVCDGVRWNIID